MAAEELEALLERGLVEDAVQRLRQLHPIPTELVWGLVGKQLEKKRYDRASRILEVLDQNSLDLNYLAQFATYALLDSQIAVAIKWSTLLKDIHPNTYDCVAFAIQRDMCEVALKYIADFNLQGFNIQTLIERLCAQENFTSARKYAQRFGLEGIFTPQLLLEMMLVAGQWENALNLRNQVTALKGSLSGLSFLQRIVESRDWVSAMRYSEQFGIPAKSSETTSLSKEKKEVIRMMIHGMIRDSKLFQAMRLTVAHQLHNEFPLKQLIQTMIRERQYAHALRFIRALGLESDFAAELPRINKERLRDLVAFRQLMSVRNRIAKHRMTKPQEPVVVVASIFLGGRTIQPKESGNPVGALSANLTTDEDDEEEIVMVQKKIEKSVIMPKNNGQNGNYPTTPGAGPERNIAANGPRSLPSNLMYVAPPHQPIQGHSAMAFAPVQDMRGLPMPMPMPPSPINPGPGGMMMPLMQMYGQPLQVSQPPLIMQPGRPVQIMAPINVAPPPPLVQNKAKALTGQHQQMDQPAGKDSIPGTKKSAKKILPSQLF